MYSVVPGGGSWDSEQTPGLYLKSGCSGIIIPLGQFGFVKKTESIFIILLYPKQEAETNCLDFLLFPGCFTASLALLFVVAFQPFQELTKELKEILIVFRQLLSGCLGCPFGHFRGLLTVGGE